MDLLQENKKKNKKTNGQKIILTLLILAIILSLIIGALIVLIQSENKSMIKSIEINGVKEILEESEMIQLQDGTNYISLKTICNKLDYEYKKGEYNIPGEESNKCHIVNNNEIVQFYESSNQIFKTTEGLYLDYQYFELTNEILSYNGDLYIALEDIPKSLNLILYYSDVNSKGPIIQTPKYWIEKNTASLEEKNIKISEEEENKKSLAYNYVIIENNSKYGVMKLNGEEVIGTKYNSILFCEYTQDFIVSNNKQYGIINNDGTAKIELQYDSIEILNYNPLLYKVQKLGKYGIMTKEGKILNEIIFDSIAYPENTENGIFYTLIIPKLNENIPESIVVCKDNMYGLIELETGNIFLDCNLKGIYLGVDPKEDNKNKYYVTTENGTKGTLEKYIDYINQITANINN